MKFPVINKMILRMSIIALICLTVSGYIGYSVYKEARNTHKKEKLEIQAYIRNLQRIDMKELEADKEIYGMELKLLYSLASNKSEYIVSSEARENAFKKLITDYPKSYTAAKVIAERAIMSANSEDLQATEKYYYMLNKYNFLNIVTDNGLDTIPNIEHKLAWLYFRKGHKVELIELSKALEEKYSEGYILMSDLRGFSRPKLRPISEAIPRLKSAISELKEPEP